MTGKSGLDAWSIRGWVLKYTDVKEFEMKHESRQILIIDVCNSMFRLDDSIQSKGGFLAISSSKLCFLIIPMDNHDG